MRPALVQITFTHLLRHLGRRRPVLSHVALFAALVLAQAPIVGVGVVPLDEGQLVNIASRLLAGEVLYRDIYTGIMPASYYLGAATIGLFGGDLLATRWLQAVLNALVFVSLLRLGLYVVRPFWAWLAPLWFVVLATISFPIYTMYGYSSLGLAVGLLVTLAWMHHLESGRAASAFAASMALAVCTLTKQNYGVFVGMACAAGWLARRPWESQDGPDLSRSMQRLVAPAAAVGAVVVAAFGVAGALWPLLEATVVTIFGAQLSAFDQPVPPIFGVHPERDGLFVFLYTPGTLFAYLMAGQPLLGVSMSPLVRSLAIRVGYGTALAAVAGALPVTVATWAVRGASAAARVFLLAAFATLFFLGMFPSAVWSHLAAVLPPLLLIPAVVADLLEGEDPPAWRRWLLRAPVALVTAAALVAVPVMVRDLRGWNDVPFGFPNASVHVSPQRRTLFSQAAEFLMDCADEGEPVFVAPDMPLLYFLTGRPNPTPYDLIIPGDVRDDRIVEILEDRHVRCVVWNPEMYPQFGPFEELFPRTHEYLVGRFETVRTVGAGGQEWRCLRRD